jgi:hypothetical protein
LKKFSQPMVASLSQFQQPVIVYLQGVPPV